MHLSKEIRLDSKAFAICRVMIRFWLRSNKYVMSSPISPAFSFKRFAKRTAAEIVGAIMMKEATLILKLNHP